MASRVSIFVHGIVQGVGFRPFIYRTAIKNGITGYVRNRKDSLVEIIAEGDERSLKDFIKELKRKAPIASQINRIDVNPLEGIGNYRRFEIVKSSQEDAARGSIIPADISICADCKREISDKKNRRFNYFFITCTNCGPRFTIIESTPYDRGNTTMELFTPCSFCTSEFQDPMDRRFHAQTIACHDCGPEVKLLNSKGEPIDNISPIEETGKIISEGYIVAVKGNGGYHIAASTLLNKPLQRLRKTKERFHKPFAIMARNVDAIKSFANTSSQEEKLLLSPAHPIILLKKKSNYCLSELISPGLDTVGVMLPYSGLHLLLFNKTNDPAFVMTSANKPSEPIIKDDDTALHVLGHTVDYFLVHNRPIVHRCDDSVIKVVCKKSSFIRRSRGYAPKPIRIKSNGEVTVGLGAELNATSCVLVDGKAFLSQHIGDVETFATLQFLEEATRHLLSLVRCKPERLACDLHPRFNTTFLGERLSKEYNIPLFRVQHHHAHAAKLLAEHKIDECVCIVCDGFGYGSDGKAWGGEVLYSNGAEFERLAHLQEHPLIGGDLATLYPLRMAASLLYDHSDFTEYLFHKSNNFRYGESEVEIVLKNAKDKKGVPTSSCGRILDAAASILDVCFERTYEGEPAMKLETAADGGEYILDFNPLIKGNILYTKPLLEYLFEFKNKFPLRNLAYSVHAYLARGLTLIAIQEAERLNLNNIGFTGGVAYNQWFVKEISSILKDHNTSLLLNEEVPCGDGGISLGQSYSSSLR